MGLTSKQQRFVTEYLVDLNATDAARRAEYTHPNKQGPRLLVNVGVAAAVTAALKAREEKTGITAEWALRRLHKEAEYTGPDSSHSARVSALGLAMKHLGMMKEDAPHPDRQFVDLKQLTDDALDRLLAAVDPFLAPALRALGGAGEVPPAAPG